MKNIESGLECDIETSFIHVNPDKGNKNVSLNATARVYDALIGEGRGGGEKKERESIKIRICRPTPVVQVSTNRESQTISSAAF